MKKFSCVEGCSDCCIYREYYPSVEYGKIGVLLLPEEKAEIENLAKEMNVKVRIVPRLAVGRELPEKVIAYQMMGKNDDGNLCPFLDTGSTKRSPHGGFSCRIYKDRPLACKAYPVIDIQKDVLLDGHCQFCKKFTSTTTTAEGLQQEIEALAKIKARVVAGRSTIWRYATHAGDAGAAMLSEGWVSES